MLNRTVCAVAAVASFSLAQPALAQVVSGTDNGSNVGGPNPNSTAAETQLLADASAYGTVSTLTFEGLPTGASASYDFDGVSVTHVAIDYGTPFSGIQNTTFGNLYGYDIDNGSGTWFGPIGGTSTFTFDQVTNSFGFYLTGLQTAFGPGLLLTDSAGQIYNIASNADGGAQYFGATTSYAVSSFTIFDQSSAGQDAWGMDRLSFVTSGVPEPATWAMMLIGFGAVGFSMRRRQKVQPALQLG